MRASVWRVGGRRVGGNGERKEGAIRSCWWVFVGGWVGDRRCVRRGF